MDSNSSTRSSLRGARVIEILIILTVFLAVTIPFVDLMAKIVAETLVNKTLVELQVNQQPTPLAVQISNIDDSSGGSLGIEASIEPLNDSQITQYLKEMLGRNLNQLLTFSGSFSSGFRFSEVGQLIYFNVDQDKGTLTNDSSGNSVSVKGTKTWYHPVNSDPCATPDVASGYLTEFDQYVSRFSTLTPGSYRKVFGTRLYQTEDDTGTLAPKYITQKAMLVVGICYTHGFFVKSKSFATFSIVPNKEVGIWYE
ncbi:MAG: hypothetical protein KDD53_09045 [Bdellovibrionales bacterium]|nr:hypothetical protein [Bdellovibrionales bacterium]